LLPKEDAGLCHESHFPREFFPRNAIQDLAQLAAFGQCCYSSDKKGACCATMLRNTFCHITGIGTKLERTLWSKGVLSWSDVMRIPLSQIAASGHYVLRYRVKESLDHLADRNARYFMDTLPNDQTWRLFGEFRDSAAYLDIETDGLQRSDNPITTIALYDGRSVTCYVRGKNLDDFRRDIQRYKLLVTYNGKSFDLPVIRRSLAVPMDQAHIDLRYVLMSLGYTGGLKGCERRFGIDRKELDGMDGFFAVLLWQDYGRTGNAQTLRTLLSYNVLDAANLEHLMVMAYNMKLKDTPFFEELRLELPSPFRNPFEPDLDTIARIMGENDRYF